MPVPTIAVCSQYSSMYNDTNKQIKKQLNLSLQTAGREVALSADERRWYLRCETPYTTEHAAWVVSRSRWKFKI